MKGHVAKMDQEILDWCEGAKNKEKITAIRRNEGLLNDGIPGMDYLMANFIDKGLEKNKEKAIEEASKRYWKQAKKAL